MEKRNDFFMWLGELCKRTVFSDKWNNRMCWFGIGLVIALGVMQATRHFFLII